MTIINKGIFDTADVFLRQTGNDWPTAQVLSTSDITEGVNLYFTNARVNAAVSGNLALKANVSDLTSANISELTNLYYTNARVLSYVSSLLTTSNVAEGSNLYYTNARVYSNVIALLPSLAGSGIAIQANGQISANAAVVTFDSISQYLTTSNVAEGSNLYYTNARVNSFIQGNLATKANVTDLTTANVAELTNLYYTNARVYSNVIALLPTLAGQNITIQANGQISASSGAVTLGDISQFLTTSNVSEGSNLYYTNTRAVSAFTEGSGIAISSGGVISARGDSAGSGLFNSGIQLVGNTLAQSTFSNVKVFSFAEGNTFIGYSFHVTNITSNIVYLTGRHVFDSNTTLFANLLEMPVGASMEVFRKPQVFRANDIIQIQGFDQNRTAVNNGISSYLSYQATVDDTYQRAGNTITGNALTTIYQTVGRVSIFESINLVNLSPNVIYGTVIVTDGSDNLVAYLAANLAIPAYASVDVCEYPKTLLDDYKIKVQKSDNFNPLSVFTSSKFTQSFAVTPSSNNMTESGIITLDLVTTNIVNGTVLYYAITGASGNINQTDFVTNTTGTVTVQNNAVRLTLQANTDLNTNLEGDETFTVVYRKNSNVGTVVATSSSIILRDTSNVTVYSLTSNVASTIAESTDVLFTLSTVNLPQGTYYWNTSGNATSSNFVTGNTGSFVSNANTSYNIVLAAGALAAGTSTDFQLRILTGSQTGTVVATSNVITIVDSSLAYMSASGGTIIVDSGGYRIHTFNTSSTLNITRLGATPSLSTISYLVMGGGASGGYGPYAGGGGGGGQANVGNITLSSTGNLTISIGAGSQGFGPAEGGTQTPTGKPGNSSNITSNFASNIFATGGSGGITWTGGTSGAGFAGGTGENGGAGGGGGGAGGVGNNRSGSNGGPGGIGYSSDISGSSSYYGGGGGGGRGPGGTFGSGGLGGGAPAQGTGAVNTGGGGGGSDAGNSGGQMAGGSGKVIIRYPYVPNLPNVNVLVVAGGGGGGGGSAGAGGGAGGYRSNSFAIANAYTVYTVVVGGGGAGGGSYPPNATRGTTGSDSVFSSITSAGGGGGGAYDASLVTANGRPGGSGGGGGGYASPPQELGTGGAGTPGQGFAGGNPISDFVNFTCAGGGGGAGAVGANGVPSGAGSGGGGVPSFISGSNVMYAGGGGGGTAERTPGTGGLGGGGNGGASAPGAPSTPGTVNTGGGGGGHNVFGGGPVGGGAGGSGVVIISYPTAYANATVLGSNVITTAVNGNIIHSFYASGNISFPG